MIARLILEKGGNKAEIAKHLGNVTPQAIGNYETGKRKVPLDFITRWKEVYGEDIIKLSETNVSHETSKSRVRAMSLIEDPDWVSMQREAWDELKETLSTQRIILSNLSETLKNLTASAGGGQQG